MNKIIQLNGSVYHIYESNGAYCTLVIGTKQALLIDSGYGCSNLVQIISTLTDKPMLLVNTHGHFDHTQANNSFPSVYINSNDVRLLNKNTNLINKLGFYFLYLAKASQAEKKQYLKTISNKKPQIINIKDGDTINIGNTPIKVIETPGHTKGSVCLIDVDNHYIYGGDTITNHAWICLKESLSVQTYVSSLEKVNSLIDDSYKIVSSHSEVPLNAIVITKLINCCKNINIEQSTVYDNPFCKNSLLYCEGIDQLKNKYNISSFEEMIRNIDVIDKEIFKNGDFMSIVYRKDKL